MIGGSEEFSHDYRFPGQLLNGALHSKPRSYRRTSAVERVTAQRHEYSAHQRQGQANGGIPLEDIVGGNGHCGGTKPDTEKHTDELIDG